MTTFRTYYLYKSYKQLIGIGITLSKGGV